MDLRSGWASSQSCCQGVESDEDIPENNESRIGRRMVANFVAYYCVWGGFGGDVGDGRQGPEADSMGACKSMGACIT